MKDHPKRKAGKQQGPKRNTAFKEGSDDDREDYMSESEGGFGGSVHAQSVGEDDEVLNPEVGIDLRGKSLKNTQKRAPSEPKKEALPLKAIMKQILDKPVVGPAPANASGEAAANGDKLEVVWGLT